MDIDMIKASLVRSQSMAELCKVFLGHKGLETWQLISHNQVVEVQSYDFLVETIHVFIEVAAAIFDAPGCAV